MLDQCRADDPFGRYLLAHFGRYDYRGLERTPPTCTFNHRLELRVGSTDVELIEVGPAHTVGDLIVHLPDSGIVCAGDIVFIGDVPVHWAARSRVWCRRAGRSSTWTRGSSSPATAHSWAPMKCAPT